MDNEKLPVEESASDCDSDLKWNRKNSMYWQWGNVCDCRSVSQGCRDFHTFWCFTFPDKIRAGFVCRRQQLPLCIFSCDVLEKPPAMNKECTEYTKWTYFFYSYWLSTFFFLQMAPWLSQSFQYYSLYIAMLIVSMIQNMCQIKSRLLGTKTKVIYLDTATHSSVSMVSAWAT